MPNSPRATSPPTAKITRASRSARRTSLATPTERLLVPRQVGPAAELLHRPSRLVRRDKSRSSHGCWVLLVWSVSQCSKWSSWRVWSYCVDINFSGFSPWSCFLCSKFQSKRCIIQVQDGDWVFVLFNLMWCSGGVHAMDSSVYPSFYCSNWANAMNKVNEKKSITVMTLKCWVVASSVARSTVHHVILMLESRPL